LAPSASDYLDVEWTTRVYPLSPIRRLKPLYTVVARVELTAAMRHICDWAVLVKAVNESSFIVMHENIESHHTRFPAAISSK
jgi:hypothetical protein